MSEISYEWAVRHINDDGTEVGDEHLPSEDDARGTLETCAHEGLPCILLRRPVSSWTEVSG